MQFSTKNLGSPVAVRRWLPGALAAVVLGGCTSDPSGPAGQPAITELPRALSADETAVIGANNTFALRSLAALVESAPAENLFYSPLSASMALGMTMNGASGDTWTEMRATLGFGALDEEAINESYRDLLSLLLTLDPSVTVDIGNSVWTSVSNPALPDFQSRVRDYFGATVEAVDFGDPASLSRINRWASDATRGKIPKMYDALPPHVVVVLLNALYFKGDWRLPFDPAQTRPGSFETADGTQVSVPLMTRDLTVAHLEDDGVQVVELPYGGGAFVFTAALPRLGESAADLAGALDDATWADWTARLTGEGRILVSLPRFRLEWERRLNDMLADLGMPSAFGAGADFTRLVPGGFWIDEVKQKAVVDVNEEGTEAAAVTGVVGVTSAPPHVRFDRPFLFAIRERLSGTILFMGVVQDPTA